MVVAGLSTGHEIGLVVVAAVFIAFALVSSFVVPRRYPHFPGRAGLSVFVIACFVLFAAMISAVAVFGREAPEAKAAPSSATASASGTVVQVQEKEFKITLSTTKVKAGKVTFAVRDVGKLQHDLAIKGPGASGKTSLISAGGHASLTVTLKKGTYVLWCTVPGHKQLGMVAKLTVS